MHNINSKPTTLILIIPMAKPHAQTVVKLNGIRVQVIEFHKLGKTRFDIRILERVKHTTLPATRLNDLRIDRPLRNGLLGQTSRQQGLTKGIVRNRSFQPINLFRQPLKRTRGGVNA